MGQGSEWSSKTHVLRKFFRLIIHGGPTKSHNKYYREGGFSSPLPKVIVVIKGVPVLVGLVLELHHGDFHTLGSQLDG
jgi:hypothetical protein